jgi:hypothetical protein
MDPLGALTLVLVFSIPMVAILSGVAKQWLKLRSQQRILGASSQELEEKVERLERANAESAQRIENLEAIVVSQTWNVLQKPGLSEGDRQRQIAAAGRQDVHVPAAEELNRQRAADLAGRLGG